MSAQDLYNIYSKSLEEKGKSVKKLINLPIDEVNAWVALSSELIKKEKSSEQPRQYPQTYPFTMTYNLDTHQIQSTPESKQSKLQSDYAKLEKKYKLLLRYFGDLVRID